MKTRSIVIALATAGFMAAAPAFAACDSCGVVTAVKSVKKEGEASGGGAVLGGIVGGVIGHQIEKKKNETTGYVVEVKMESGATRTFNYSNSTAFKAGDKVKIVDKKLVKQ